MAKITLEAARRNANLTQVELAEKMHVSKQSVFDWENGKRRMKPAYLYLFCSITGFNVDDILLPEITT